MNSIKGNNNKSHTLLRNYDYNYYYIYDYDYSYKYSYNYWCD